MHTCTMHKMEGEEMGHIHIAEANIQRCINQVEAYSAHFAKSSPPTSQPL